MIPLFDMTVRGSLVFLAVFTLDSIFFNRMSAAWRRLWWAAVPLAFLVPFRLPIMPAPDLQPAAQTVLRALGDGHSTVTVTYAPASPLHASSYPLLPILWMTGAVIYLLIVFIQTLVASRRWSRERLSTDSSLLNLLEDSKQSAGVTAPIGLVVSDKITAPALLGWLRPRILLPRELAGSMPRAELQAVFLHELAHFRSLDIPLGWLFTLARAVHWFNPLAHAAGIGWSRFREEAADEAAIRWGDQPSGENYGEALLHALKQASGHQAPFGALAIGESLHNLKRRMTMIPHHHKKSARSLLATTVCLLLVGLTVIQFTSAQTPDREADKKAALAAMEAWLAIDNSGKYGEGWDAASKYFKDRVTRDKWIALGKQISDPLGACTGRKLASCMIETEIPDGKGSTLKGLYAVAQFETSFANMKYTIETVSFEKEADGVWRMDGYYIKPR